MKRLVECVPNFSEGRDSSTINAITAAIGSVDGINVLNVDMGAATNRTVVTFVGEPEAVIRAAFIGIQKAAELIDMSQHTGEHPRMGATDVVPIIPLSGVTVQECLPLVEELAERVGSQLGIPVYLYNRSARSESRARLPDIRDGEYEALEKKLSSGEFNPDYGPASFNAGAGATAIGVRDFLLAYNINLSTWDPKVARDIAMTVREKGRAKRERSGAIVRDNEGVALRLPGRLTHCQAGGWFIKEYGYAQVTMNLTNFRETGLYEAFTVVSQEAAKRGVRVTGSEVVGLLPREAILDAGTLFLEAMGANTGIPERQIVDAAILGLGLNDTTAFDPAERIVEYAIEAGRHGVSALRIREFSDELSSDSMAPGGGSVSALGGALAASLVSMVANLTFGKKGYERQIKPMKEISIRAQALKSSLLDLVDRDTDAFNGYIDSLRLPKKTESERTRRDRAVQLAAVEMTTTPLETLRLCREVMGLAEVVLKKGNPSALSDAFVAVAQASAASEGAYMNVKINLPEINDQEFVSSVSEEAESLLTSISRDHKRLFAFVRTKL